VHVVRKSLCPPSIAVTIQDVGLLGGGPDDVPISGDEGGGGVPYPIPMPPPQANLPGAPGIEPPWVVVNYPEVDVPDTGFPNVGPWGRHKRHHPGKPFCPPPMMTPPGAVPEPGGWVLMIVGIGLVGIQLRRRPLTGEPT
jgi:hypothetical protein